MQPERHPAPFRLPESRPRLLRLFRLHGLPEPDFEFRAVCSFRARRYALTPTLQTCSLLVLPASTQAFDPRLGAATSLVPQPGQRPLCPLRAKAGCGRAHSPFVA